MNKLTVYSGLGMALVLGIGCSPSLGTSDQDNVRDPLKVCTRSDGTCAESNCDDINQPYQGAGSDFSMTEPNTLSYRYKLTGFYRTAMGTWAVRGFHVKQDPLHPIHVSADGFVSGLSVGGVTQKLVNLSATNGVVKLTYCTPGAAGCGAGIYAMATGAALAGTRILLQVPNAPGLSTGSIDYTLQFDSAPQVLNLVTPNSVDIKGYKFSYFYSGVTAQSLCKGPMGTSQRTFLYQDTYWNPETFARTEDGSAITLTCELGAIAACMSWGYKPWESSTFGGNAVSVRDWHATCVNMKTANYCGDGYSWTRSGTPINVNDPLTPQVMTGSLARLEAFWDTHGAVCVNDGNRRVPSLMWSTSSCYATMPSCASLAAGGALNYLGSAIP